MSSSIYEAHLLTNKALPFIFNNDYADKYIDIIPNNWHPNIELLLFTKGNGTVVLGEREISVEAGDIVIINSNVMHTITAEKKIYYYYLIPDNEFCLQNGIDAESIRFESYIKDEKAQDLYNNVIEEFSGDGESFRNAGIKCAVLNLLVYLARNYTKADNTKAGTTFAGGINYSIGYIMSHINDRLTLDELSHQAGLSKYHFARQFKLTTGYTPIEFINITRCENAKTLILQGELALCEIAEKCGFETTSYFIKTFKKYIGETPGKLLRKAQMR